MNGSQRKYRMHSLVWIFSVLTEGTMSISVVQGKGGTDEIDPKDETSEVTFLESIEYSIFLERVVRKMNEGN